MVSRQTSRGLVSAHNDARRRDGRPRDGEFAAVEPYPPGVEAAVAPAHHLEIHKPMPWTQELKTWQAS